MYLKWILFISLLTYVNALYLQCQMPRLAHGKVRGRQNRKLIKFSCNIGYELVGNRYATCMGGQWDTPQPVCIRPSSTNCPIPDIERGVKMVTRGGAWVVFFCLPGFKLVGSTVIYCDGTKWNTTKPTCIDGNAPTQLSCDFESPDLCGWTQDSLHDFDWERLNRKTPSSFLRTGPSFDHTFGEGHAGYYMYIESSSRIQNETARLISPVFDMKLAENGCFAFYYHMFGRDIGGLRVYQKPDSARLEVVLNLPEEFKRKYLLFEMWGNQGDFWYGDVLELVDFGEDFQIVIEGIRGKKFTSDIAIDDVAILQGSNCSTVRNMMPTPPSVIPETCEGRCGNQSQFSRGCACSMNCLVDNNCCRDYFETCLYVNDLTSPEDSDPTSSEMPQTQKLVADNTPMLPSTTQSTTKVPSPPEVSIIYTIKNTTERTTPPVLPLKPVEPPTTKPAPIPTTQKPEPTTRLTPKSTEKPKTTQPPVKTTQPAPKTTKLVPKPTEPVKTTKAISTTTVLPKPKLPSTKKNITYPKDAIIDKPKSVSNATTPKTTNNGQTAKVTKKEIVLEITTTKPKTKLPIDHVTKKIPAAVDKRTIEKENKEIFIQTKAGKLKDKGKSSAWRPVLITLAVFLCFGGLAWLVYEARGPRGRVALAKLRRRTTNDPEVRYLHADQDDLDE